MSEKRVPDGGPSHPIRGFIPRILGDMTRDKRATAALWLLAAFLGYSGFWEFAVNEGPFSHIQDAVVTYLDSSRNKAIEAFAVARAINGTLSVLESIDLSAVFAQVRPLEFLEPVDDLAKQFSDVMVVSITSIIMQRLLLTISQIWALTVALPIGCLLLFLSACSHGFPPVSRRLAALGRLIVILALFARFAILATGWVGSGLAQSFADELTPTMTAINVTGSTLDQINEKATGGGGQSADEAPSASTPPASPAPLTGSQSVDDALRAAQSYYNKGTTWVKKVWQDRTSAAVLIVSIKDTVADLPQLLVKAIAVFEVQTIVTPLMVAFFFYHLLLRVIQPTVRITLPQASPILGGYQT